MAESQLVARREPMSSLDEIPRVCFIDDLARAMRTSEASLKLQHKCGFAYFPALPTMVLCATAASSFDGS